MAIIVLYQGFCYIKDIRIYLVIGIIDNNDATEITRLLKNRVALKNLAPSENLAPPAPHRIQPPLIVRLRRSFWNLAPKAIYFSAPLLPGGAFYELVSRYFVKGWTSSLSNFFRDFEEKCVYRKVKFSDFTNTYRP